MTSTFDYDVVVVGAGPTGMTLALSLARNGLKTLVFDKEQDVYPLPRAAHVDHEIMRIYQDFGVGDEVAETCRLSATYDFTTRDGRMLMQFGGLNQTGPAGWPVGNMIHQPSIERIVRSAAAKEDKLDLQSGWEFLSYQQSETGVEAVVSTPSGVQTICSRFLVGADGARSPVRTFSGIEQEDLSFDEPWVVVDVFVKDYDRLPKANLQICDPERPTTCVLMGSGRHRWEFMLKDDESPEQMSTAEAITKLLEPWDVDGAVEIERTAVYRFNAKVAKDWRVGRVFLAGDAAHLTPPFAGQGLCAGLRDAVNLAWKLTECINHSAPDALLDTYQDERKPHARGFIEFAVAMGRTVCTTDHVVAKARDEQMLAAQASGEAQTPPPPIALLSGCMTSGAAAGQYFPQPVVQQGDRLLRMDEALPQTALLITRTTAEMPNVPELTQISLSDPVLAPFEMTLMGWLDQFEAEAVLVRPDHYVFGAGAQKELIESWLQQTKTTESAPVSGSDVQQAVPGAAPKEKLLMSIDGTWELTANTPMGAQKSTVTLKADGATVTGEQTGAQGAGALSDGVVDGNKVSWKTSVNVPIPLTLAFSGEVDGDAISGHVKAGSFGSFPFTGNRVS